MTIHFKRIVLIWVLQLTASSAQTTGLNHNITDVATAKVKGNSAEGQMTTQKASSPFLLVSSHNFTPSMTADANPSVETTQTQTKPSKTLPNPLLSNDQTAATPTNSTSSQLNISTVSMSTTEVQIRGRTTATTVVTTLARNPTTATTIPLIQNISTQSQNTAKTSTFQLTSDKMTQRSTRPAQSTHPISTTVTSTKPADKSTSPGPSQSPVTHSSTAMEKKPFNQITKAKEGENAQGKNEKSNEEINHGKIVAGLIGGALIVMMLGFLVIFIKKRRLQKRQVTTTDWAGPSPFLEGAAENGEVTRRSSNRISLASFLPHRLSKRLSLLPETDEELQDMTAGTTFGEKHQGITFGQEVHSSDVQESNGTAVGVPENKSTGDPPETAENSVSVTSSQTNNPISTNDNSETAHHGQDSLATVSEPVESALVQLNDDLK